MIVIADEAIAKLPGRRRGGVIRFSKRDGGDVYTSVASRRSRDAVQGTLLVTKASRKATAQSFGRRGDVVRVLLWRRTNRGSSRGQRMGAPAPWEAQGFVRVRGRWRASPVQLMPARDELFSRNRGIIETDVLADRTVFVAGLGSAGGFCTLELAKVGANLILNDFDRLEPGNVSRHVLGLSDVGRYKTKAMADAVRERNPYASVETLEAKISGETIEALRAAVRKSDVVVAAVDEREARGILNKVCYDERKPLIVAGASHRACVVQVLRLRPGVTACYQCFLSALPRDERDEGTLGEEEAIEQAYTNRPVPPEPGLSVDIAQVSLMAVKLAIQELLQGKPSALHTLDDDLTARWYMLVNRRGVGTDYERLESLGFGTDGFRILRWYGIPLERDPECPCCGRYAEALARSEGIEITDEMRTAFRREGGAQ